MLENFPFFLALVVIIVLLIMLADKAKIAYPVLLILAGLGIGFIPGVPILHIEPELIFLIFLPPLLYEAAWTISWKELWKWRRVICSFAFVIVFLTALSVAFVANYFIPGFSLALGFLLGGIVSPPDAVSAGAIMKFVRLPRTIASILEGESLLNDAASLIILRFALIAVATGQFVWYAAAGSFAWMVIGGIAIGLIVGWLFMKLHKYLPTDANMDIILSIVAPYIMYIAAEKAHSSGVLAVVSGGLYLSNNRHLFLSSTSRVRGFNVWQSLCFILNGLVFIMIGLALPEITSGLGEVSISAAIGYSILVTAVLIIGRILSSYGVVAFTLIAKHFITVADGRNPGIKGPLIIGWTGMRGVVSLAAALSIPLQLEDGSPFPQRNLILFITFVVILLTLLLQGLTLPYLIRMLNLSDRDQTRSEDEIDNEIKQQLAQHALTHLKTNYPEELKRQPILQQIADKWENSSALPENAIISEETKTVYRAILNRQRLWLIQKNKEEQALDEEIIRRHLHRIDMEEEKWRLI
ncbi:Na+/H+ antiporter [Flavobacterium noncentrifugens]|uniref:Monovalent cation:H+ antiporter, CPA1 family n=1 Tax=Flavobacterium noncentrifugens TaxID=1128970 RepID=A0A1G8WQF0_9FLAO|nr:Na+/H+ antiporter [Flavobacterium noncentrifugens]GEP51021.1 Na+/H+ antiporter [Flavobacterium noncentrifugens]SDJ80602.1 monovalent cation:H+ antiporter, CPA1 family [Flavobacterium noncentrifugens]